MLSVEVSPGVQRLSDGEKGRGTREWGKEMREEGRRVTM